MVHGIIEYDLGSILLVFEPEIMIERNRRGHSYCCVRERKLEVRRRSDTALVLTVNYANQRFAEVHLRLGEQLPGNQSVSVPGERDWQIESCTKKSNNRSVMPFDVRGCTRATMKASTELQLFPLNEEFPIRRDYPLNLSISISGGKETKTNSPSSGERNEKSPYTEVGEQLCSLDWGFRAGAGPITNDVLCMVSRLLIESGCLRLQPKAGGKSHPRLNIRTRPIANKYREGKQTDGADGAILTKISRRWVRWRMNLLQTCLCRLSFDSNLRTVHFWSISVTSNVRKCFAADILLLSQLPCHCRISRMNVVVDKMKSIVLRSIVMGLLVPLRSWVSAHDLSGTIVDQSVSERAHWYPKDGELCLSRMKPEETLVEVRSGVKVPDIGAHEIPEKVLVDIDSRTVAMEVGIRQGVCNNSPAESTSPENG
ncbi:Carboxy-S-adenosyl-L-methionine synthase [Trichinella spiralis]|uniref:Carboxy-S-adenosyl-L-methionine synthase n=1 Tax=Trichinella spiralis TaxID=6334 RepID=A0ABR3K4J7_TRISP